MAWCGAYCWGDDLAPNQHLVTSVLGKRGHQVVVATSGGEALDILARDEILTWC